MIWRRPDAAASEQTVRDLQLARDRALVARMVRGDQRAVREFCDTYLPRLYRFALQRVALPADADDVVQIVLSTAARRIETYRGDSPLYAWLLTICRREAGRYAAAAARHQSVMDPNREDGALAHLEAPAHEAPEAASRRRQLTGRVRRCLDSMPGHYAEALELKYLDGYSSKEIAAKLSISDEAVQSLLARARRTFRDVVDHELREDIETDHAEP
jgi:RNA polymerase sigma-70 factor (ECF subfamily)